ncbi:unnamed protein product, partial [Rotaria sp. Silwood2]
QSSPDEILLVIMNKFDSMNVLYSFLGVNRRLDQMTRNIDKIDVMNLSFVLPNGQLALIDDVKLNQFVFEILFQIHHKVVTLRLA